MAILRWSTHSAQDNLFLPLDEPVKAMGTLDNGDLESPRHLQLTRRPW
jgi:hypothetical protein